MTRCSEYQQQILDGLVSEDLAAHVRTCRECRELEQGHRAALGLKLGPIPRPVRIDRRRVRRRLGLVAGAVAGLCSLFLLRAPVPVPPVAGPTAEQAFSEADAAWTVFWAQLDAAGPGRQDPSRLAFGPLGDWMAPTRLPAPVRPSSMTVVWTNPELEE